MKREKLAFLVLLVEIVAITVLHSAKNRSNQPVPAANQQAVQTATYQWNNNNLSLIRIR